MTVEKRTLGRTGLDISVLGFGGAPIGVLACEQGRVDRLLNRLLDEGVNLIDTAANYWGSEAPIGKAVGHRRREYVLVSKCGVPLSDPRSRVWTSRGITRSIHQSLERLGTDRLDVILLHSCDLEVLKRDDVLGALTQAREAGKVGFVGYSGDNDAAAYAAEMPELDVLQTSINLCDQANVDVVLPKAVHQSVGVMAKRPIANAAWKDLAEQPGAYASYARIYTERFKRMAITSTELGFSGDPEQVWPEIALRFTLSQPGVHTAMIGTTNLDHALANVRAAGEGALPESAVEQIRSAFRRAEAAAGTRWQGEI